VTPVEPVSPLLSPPAPLQYQEPSSSDKFWTSFKLAFALPWRRFKKESVLTFKVRCRALPSECAASWGRSSPDARPPFPLATHLLLQLEGEIPDALQSRFSPGTSVPQLCSALEKAALDPRVVGICFEVGACSRLPCFPGAASLRQQAELRGGMCV
jgi:protease-4